MSAGGPVSQGRVPPCGRHSSRIEPGDAPNAPDRGQLGLLRALRLIRALDRQLDEIEPDPGLAQQMAEGWITPEEFHRALELPDSTGAVAVLQDGLGLHPALAADELEMIDKRLNENGWATVTIEHLPTRVRCHGRAQDASLARQIARCFLARLVWTEVIMRLERQLAEGPRADRRLDRVIAGESTAGELQALVETRRGSDKGADLLSSEFEVGRDVTRQLLDGSIEIDSLVERRRGQLLAELGSENARRLRCSACGFDYTERRAGESCDPAACPGTYVVFEQTFRWQGTEPLGCPVPAVAHAHHCGESLDATSQQRTITEPR